MNAILAGEFARKHAAQLESFGELVTFWPGGAQETNVTAIVFRSARPESRTPGNVTNIFFIPSDLPALPAKNDLIQIGADEYVLEDPLDSGDGSATVIVRKKSQSTP